MHTHSSNSRRTRPMILSCLLALSAALPSTTLAQPQKATARAFPPDSVVLAIIKQRVEEKRSAGIVVGMIDASGKTRILSYGDPGPGQPPLDASAANPFPWNNLHVAATRPSEPMPPMIYRVDRLNLKFPGAFACLCIDL